MLKDLVLYIAQSLVDHADAVRIAEVENEHATIFELRVAKEDLGKVIGKQGRTARAIRMVLTAASARLQKRVVLEILE